MGWVGMGRAAWRRGCAIPVPGGGCQRLAVSSASKYRHLVMFGAVDEAGFVNAFSRAIQRSIGNQKGITATLHAIANVYPNQGKVEESIALYEESLAIKRSIGNAHGIASTLAMLAQIIAVQQKDFGTAIDYRPHSETTLRHIGSPDADQVAEILQWVEGMAH
jgi:tetratricopeptide (TPR) repeat protein